MRIDPYSLKRLPKYHHKRLLYTFWARLTDRYSRIFFEEYALPPKDILDLPPAPEADWNETQVTPHQARYLLWGLRSTDNLPGCVVEVGAWRGVTTSYLAKNTASTVAAVDPWIGGGNEQNWRAFQERTESLPNIAPLRKPFGEAVRNWDQGRARFIFIDAAHDYANVAHDLSAARSLTATGGIIALHDTDNILFSGCRRAVYEAADQFELAAHVENLVLFRVRSPLS